MDLKTIWQQCSSGRLRRFWRRAVAMVLALSCLLPANAFAVGASSLLRPAQATADEFPEVEVQGNLVRDEFGFLTGYFELALRVRTPEILTDGVSADPKVYRTFRSLSLSLQYDTSVLTPVGWGWAADPALSFNDQNSDVPLNTSSYYQTQLPTKKYDKVSTAAAQSGVVAGAAGSLTQEVLDGKQALLFFEAETYKAVSFPDMTTLAVIRFYVNPAETAKFTIAKNAAGDYDLSYQGTTVNKLSAWTGAASGARPVVSFAEDGDIYNAISPALYALRYRSGDNEFYFVPSYDPGNPNTYETVAVNAAHSVTAPKTLNERILAVKAGGTETDPDYYSYTTNLLPKDNLDFTLVSQLSFADSGSNIDNLATIVFYDWDNTLLGVLTVPKHKDVRSLVNDYVKANMIHPQLQNNTNYSSILRADNYRGRYPYSGPAGDPASEVVGDGDKYPLTYKLDYTFFKRNMEEVMSADPVNPGPTGEWTQSTAVPFDEDYPLTKGWALCEKDTVEETWTTLGVGELSDYTATTSTDASFTVEDDMPFEFADFQNGVDKSEVYVKAVYEPGDPNQFDAYNTYSTIKDSVYYGQYAMIPSSQDGTAYVIKLQYERVMDGRGVRRTRDPAVFAKMTPDNEGVAGGAFFTKIVVANADIIDAEITPASKVVSIGYGLRDQYDNNYVTGERRSSASENELDIYDNFNYNEYPYSERFGSEGFVFEGTYRRLLEAGVEAIEGDASGLTSILQGTYAKDFYEDLNFKLNAAGDSISSAINFAMTYNKIVKLFNEVASQNGKDAILALDWHQLQYHIINAQNDGTGGAIGSSGILSASDCISLFGGTGFDWCKLHGVGGNCVDGGGSSGGNANPVSTWAELLYAAKDAETNNKSLNNLTAVAASNSPFYLRADLDGTEYTSADLANLKLALKGAVANVPAGTNYENLTWGQVQYYIIEGEYPANLADADTAAEQDYWWVNGGAAVADVETLLTAADRADTSLTTPDGKNHATWPANLNTATADMNKVSGAPLRLRKSNAANPADGAPYTDAGDFQAAIKALVNKAKAADAANWSDAVNGLGNWDILQYYLIHATAAYAPATDAATIAAEVPGYWWKYGEQVKDWATLMAAADAAVDGTDPSHALLGTVESDLLTDATAAIYLRSNTKGDMYTASGMTDFVNALAAVATAVHAAGQTMSTLTWDEVQYYLAQYGDNGSIGTYPAAQADVADGVDNHYWWKDGGVGVIDFATLIQAAQEAYGTDGTDGKWANLNSVQAGDDVPGLRKGFDGTKYETADVPAFKTAMAAMIGDAAAGGLVVDGTSWNFIQYYVLHGNSFGNAGTMNGEANTYYWWKDGGAGSGAPVTISAPADAETAVDVLLKAAFNSGINGDQDAWNQLTDGNIGGILSDDAQSYFLYPAWAGTETARTDFAAFGSGSYDKEYFTGLMDTLAQNAVDVTNGGDFTASTTYYNAGTKALKLDWYQIQYALLHNGSIPDSADYAAAKNDYWWLKAGSAGTAVASKLDTLLDLMSNFANGDITTAQFNNNTTGVTLTLLKTELGLKNTKAGGAITSVTTPRTRLRTLSTAVKNVAGNAAYRTDLGNGKVCINLSWYQIQYYIWNNPTAATVIVDPATAYNYYVNNYTGAESRPSFVPKTTDDGADQLPTRVPDLAASAAAFALMLPEVPEALPEPETTTSAVRSEDGLTETTTTTTRTYHPETGDWDTVTVITAVTRVQAGETETWVTTVTTIAAGLDPETGEWKTTTTSVTTTSGAPAEAPEAPPQPSPELSEEPLPEETAAPESPAPEESREPEETPEPAPESPAPEESGEPQETPEPTPEAGEPPATEESASPSRPDPAEPEDSQEPAPEEDQPETAEPPVTPRGWQSSTARTVKFRRILSPGRPKSPGHPWGGADGGYAAVWVRDTGQRAGPLERNLLTRGGPLKSTLASSDAKWRITI